MIYLGYVDQSVQQPLPENAGTKVVTVKNLFRHFYINCVSQSYHDAINNTVQWLGCDIDFFLTHHKNFYWCFHLEKKK